MLVHLCKHLCIHLCVSTAEHPSCFPAPVTPGALRRSKRHWCVQEKGVLQGPVTLAPQPGSHSLPKCLPGVADKVRLQITRHPGSAKLPSPAALPHPHSPTYMTPSLVFSAASVTPCLVFSTAPTTPSLAMEKPFLKTSMVVCRNRSLALPVMCCRSWRECCRSGWPCCCLLLTPVKY